MNIIYLDPREAAHAAKHPKEMVIVRPLKEQPPKGYKRCPEPLESCENACFKKDNTPFYDWYIKLRYPVGKGKYVGKESWGYAYSNAGIRYYDYRANPDPYLILDGKWMSLVTMPYKASRFKNLVVVRNRVDKVHKLSWHEIEQMGMDAEKNVSEYPDYITAKYGKDVWDKEAEILRVEV